MSLESLEPRLMLAGNPTALPDAYEMNENTTLTVNAPGVLGNDTDPDGEPLEARLVNSVSNGTLVLNRDGSFTYTPNTNFFGTDTFTYFARASNAPGFVIDDTVSQVIFTAEVDGELDSAIVNLDGTLIVSADPAAPPFTSLNISDLMVTITDSIFLLPGGLAFMEAPPDTISLTLTQAGPPASVINDQYTQTDNRMRLTGALTVEDFGFGIRDGTYPFNNTETISFSGDITEVGDELQLTITFDLQTVTIMDGVPVTLGVQGLIIAFGAVGTPADSDPTTVTITVNQVDDPPMAQDDQYFAIPNTLFEVDALSGVLKNDTDLDTPTLTARLVDPPTAGLLTFNSDGSFSYLPQPGFLGNVFFTYVANDGTSDSNLAQVTLTFQFLPIVVDDAYTVNEDTVLTANNSPIRGVLFNDTHPGGLTMTALLVDNVQHGTLTLNSNGTFTYTPATDYSGPDSFTYRAVDSNNAQSPRLATVNITVVEVNDPPVGMPDAYSTLEDTPLIVTALTLPAPTTLVSMTGPWHYLDELTNGQGGSPLESYPLDALGRKWTDPGFDVATSNPAIGAWRMNTGPFAQGAIDYFNNNGLSPAGLGGGAATNTTYLFRTQVNVPNGSQLSQITIRLVVDDGGVLYLNGREIYRVGLPAGPVTTTTETITDGAENTLLTQTILVGGLMVDGLNTFAFELHQTNLTSSDAGFGIEIVAQGVAGVLANDTDIDSPQLFATLVSAPANGKVTLLPNGTFTYTPNPEFSGVDTFQYRVTDVPDFNPPPPGGGSGTFPNTGSTWRFLDNGTNQGTAWRNLGFNDSTWRTGPTQIGYGDGDEATVASFGPDANNKYVTTYFRHTFNVPDPTTLAALTGRVLRDDQVAVYINGTEVYRDPGLPAGAAFNTLATAQPASETEYITFNVPLSLLVAGNNVVAAEVHQNAVTSSDLSFDLVLTPTTPLQTVTITVQPHDDVPDVADDEYAVLQNGTLRVNDLRGVVWNDRDPDSTLQALVTTGPANGTLIMNLDGSFTYTPNPGFSGVDSFRYSAVEAGTPLVQTVLLGTNSVWRILDNGSDQGTAWRALNFNDASWRSGPSPFGYGESAITTSGGTIVADGFQFIPPTTQIRYVTTYYRTNFTINDLSQFNFMEMRFRRDDGIAIYLNGVEIVRNNLAADATFNTLATADIEGAAETTVFITQFGTALLRQGVNTLAVEIHQSRMNSGDTYFDLSLAGLKFNPPRGFLPEGEVNIRVLPNTGPPAKPGDMNNDMVVNAVDIDLLYAGVNSQTTDPFFDVNGSGQINEADVTHLIENILRTRRGDTNTDGKVDITDLATVAAYFGQASDVRWGRGDMNGDGRVGIEDLTHVATNFGFVRTGGAGGGSSAAAGGGSASGGAEPVINLLDVQPADDPAIVILAPTQPASGGGAAAGSWSHIGSILDAQDDESIV